jgi:hypothetical protein
VRTAINQQEVPVLEENYTCQQIREGEKNSFVFRDIASIPRSTGQRAESLHQLRDLLAEVSDECIFHHTYRYFAKGHTLEYTNDFAQWAGKSLEEGMLAEHLSLIDPYSFATVADLRGELLRVIDSYAATFPAPRMVMPGNEFYFMETVTFIFPARLRVQNLAEFLIALKYVDISSIYYHFYEARVRLGRQVDDFSKWVEEVLGAPRLAANIRAIDLFMHNLEGIRDLLSGIIEQELRDEMEVLG